MIHPLSVGVKSARQWSLSTSSSLGVRAHTSFNVSFSSKPYLPSHFPSQCLAKLVMFMKTTWQTLKPDKRGEHWLCRRKLCGGTDGGSVQTAWRRCALASHPEVRSHFGDLKGFPIPPKDPLSAQHPQNTHRPHFLLFMDFSMQK